MPTNRIHHSKRNTFQYSVQLIHRLWTSPINFWKKKRHSDKEKSCPVVTRNWLSATFHHHVIGTLFFVFLQFYELSVADLADRVAVTPYVPLNSMITMFSRASRFCRLVAEKLQFVVIHQISLSTNNDQKPQWRACQWHINCRYEYFQFPNLKKIGENS